MPSVCPALSGGKKLSGASFSWGRYVRIAWQLPDFPCTEDSPASRNQGRSTPRRCPSGSAGRPALGGSMSVTPKPGRPGKITCRDMVLKPLATGERSVAANKNLRIQNSGRRGVDGQRRDAWCPAAFMCEEILTGDRWVRRTPYVAGSSGVSARRSGFWRSSPARQSVRVHLQIQHREPAPS